MKRFSFYCLFVWVFLAPGGYAGIHYSEESYDNLPSQWRGFLLDQRQLRQIGMRPLPSQPSSPLRKKYEQDLSRLEKEKQTRPLLPVELADLGALHLRLGNNNKALELLSQANRLHPSQYLIVSNLASAWHQTENLDQAILHTKEAVELAPGKWLRAESLYLSWLVELRKTPGGNKTPRLFSAPLVNPKGQLDPGRIPPDGEKLLPGQAVASAQILGLWFPADGRLLYRIAELANATGDASVAAAILDGCVREFGLSTPEIQEQRKILRDFLEKKSPDQKHGQHLAGWFVPKSFRALKQNLPELPLIDNKGVNAISWEVLALTQIGKLGKAEYPSYVQQLAAKQVALEGYMQPVGDDFEAPTFLLLQHPVGCWYCEMPLLNGMIFVQLASDKTMKVTRDGIRVSGTLELRGDDPEKFLFTLRQAKAETLP